MTTSVHSHLLLPPCPCFTAHALLVWALGWWMPPFISYVLPQCVCVRCGVWCVCGWASPEYAAVAQCPRVRAPSAVHQRLREFTLRSPIRSFGSRLSICPCAGGRRGSLHVLSPVLPTPHRAPSPATGVCVSGPVCDMRMWCDDEWARMLLHGSWWREGRGGFWCPACEFLDGARYPTPHRR